MEKTVKAFDARRQFGKILQEVAAKGDKFVVERHGEPIAAVVPKEVYQQLKPTRQAFIDKIRVVSQRANLTEEEAEKLVREAVRAVRGQE